MSTEQPENVPPILTKDTIVAPGDIIGAYDSKYIIGDGIYILQGVMFASVLGAFKISQNQSGTVCCKHHP